MFSTKQPLLAAIIAFALQGAPLCSDAICLSQMSQEEQKSVGLEKLSPEEKHALDQWLAKVTAKQTPAPVMQKSKFIHGEFVIKATRDLGRYISLENGFTYEIPSRSRKKTMAWKVGDKVRVVEPIRPVNYKLENIQQDQVVGGKVVPAPAAQSVQKDVQKAEKAE